MKKSFTEEQANAILQRALERLPLKCDMTPEQLQSIAEEMGVAPDVLWKAEEEWEVEELDKADRRVFISERRRRFYGHLGAYAVISVLFLLVAFLSGENDAVEMAVIWLSCWAVGVLVHGIAVLRTDGMMFEKKLARWRIRRKARQFAAEEYLRLSRRGY